MMNLEIAILLGFTPLMVFSRPNKIEGPCNVTLTNVTCGLSKECFVYSPDNSVRQRRDFPDTSINGLSDVPDNSVDESRDFPDNSVDELRDFPDNSVDELRDFPDISADQLSNFPDNSVDGSRDFLDYPVDGSSVIPDNSDNGKRAICLDKGKNVENRRVRLSINCPDKKKVGFNPGLVDRLNCAPGINDQCMKDSECNHDQICCHNGCWWRCTEPESQYSP